MPGDEKPSVEQPNMSEVFCACFIAHFEGRRGTALPEDLLAASTLPELDRRLRLLEIQASVTASLPTTAPSWDSLAWRIIRLQQKMSRGYSNYLTALPKTPLWALVPQKNEMSLETVAAVIEDIAARQSLNMIQPQPQRNQLQQHSTKLLVSDEETLDILRQRLCYMLGKARCVLDKPPGDRVAVFVRAVELSLDLENTSGSPPRYVGMPPPPASWRNRPTQTKACCGCCSCSCHPKQIRGGPPGGPMPPVNIIDVPYKKRQRQSKIKRFFKFGWMKKLACWRRRVDDDDSSSTTSGTSSTLTEA
jgi:hypothetical protein